MEIEIINWEKYNHQDKRVNYSRWFRFENNFFSNEKLYDLNAKELLCFVYLLCLKSSSQRRVNADQTQSKRNRLLVSRKHVVRNSRVSWKTMQSSICKLSELKVIKIISHSENIGAPMEKHRRNIGTHQSTKQDSTLQNKTAQTPSGATSAPPPPSLFDLWNKHSGQLPKTKKLTPHREKKIKIRLKESDGDPEEYWTHVIKRIAASDFCNGKSDRGWIATFDWLISQDNHVKVMEGKYDNRTGGNSFKNKLYDQAMRLGVIDEQAK